MLTLTEGGDKWEWTLVHAFCILRTTAFILDCPETSGNEWVIDLCSIGVGPSEETVTGSISSTLVTDVGSDRLLGDETMIGYGCCCGCISRRVPASATFSMTFARS